MGINVNEIKVKSNENLFLKSSMVMRPLWMNSTITIITFYLTERGLAYPALPSSEETLNGVNGYASSETQKIDRVHAAAAQFASIQGADKVVAVDWYSHPPGNPSSQPITSFTIGEIEKDPRVAAKVRTLEKAGFIIRAAHMKDGVPVASVFESTDPVVEHVVRAKKVGLGPERIVEGVSKKDVGTLKNFSKCWLLC